MTWRDIEPPPGQEGAPGSEGGKIILDQEHSDGARITLERDARTAPFAITCGIYGWMVHTRFFSDGEDARQQYAKMRVALDAIVDGIRAHDDPLNEQNLKAISQELADFVACFP